MRRGTFLVILLISMLFLNGCALVFQKGRRSDRERIQSLEDELSDLRTTKSLLERRLSSEIKGDQVKLSMEDKGLVITFVAEVLFDSGKAQLREASFPILDKVARILKEEVPGNEVGIEGHTDNQPIKYSKWKSNWELSAHRALSVLEYLIGKDISPQRLSAVAYGEYHPVGSNATVEGRQKNRRVEIVIIPRVKKRVSESLTAVPQRAYEEKIK